MGGRSIWRASLRHLLPNAAFAGVLALFCFDARVETGAIEFQAGVVGLAAILGGILLYHRASGHSVDAGTLAQQVYLLAVATIEEWSFRVALPSRLAENLGPALAVTLSAALFGGLHRLTLRQSPVWCLRAALFGIALSVHFEVMGSFWIIVALHWVASASVWKPSTTI